MTYIHKNEIHQLLTKYYYNENNLRYQILAQMKDSKTYILADCMSFSEYKQTIADIETKFQSGIVVEVNGYLNDTTNTLGKVA